MTKQELETAISQKKAYIAQVDGILKTTPKTSKNYGLLMQSKNQAITSANEFIKKLNHIVRDEAEQAAFEFNMLKLGSVAGYIGPQQVADDLIHWMGL